MKINEDQLAALNESFPIVAGDKRISLPRMGMLSKDITKETGKGKTKKIELVEAGGTFYTETDSGKEETDEDGKIRKIWDRDYSLGEEIEVIIPFHRKQLKYFDKSLNKFISTPIFDNDDQIIPLFLDKRQIAKGTKEELQAKYPALTQKGKKTSDLKEFKILYVIFEGSLYQMDITPSSGWAFSKYAKSFSGGMSPATVITKISSLEETNGSNTYRVMNFSKDRVINSEEFDTVKEKQDMIKESVDSDKKFYLGQASVKVISEEKEAEDSYNRM